MRDFCTLTKHLEIIGQEDFGKWIVNPDQLPFVNYGEEIYRLRDAIADLPGQHPEMNLYEYQAILKEQGLGGVSIKEVDVSHFDARTVAALLVAAYREERFCDGYLMDCLEKGCIQRWLQRLQELDGAER